MKYKVTYNQWYRCGRYGDDKDYDIMSLDFNTLCAANTYVTELVAGKYKNRGDCTVHRNEVTIKEYDEC